MIFKYRGFDKNGKSISSNIEAKNLEEAKSKLKAKGVIYKSIKEGRESLNILTNLKKQNMEGEVLATFCKELSTYLKSGMTIVTALKLLIDSYKESKKFNLFLNSILNKIEEGSSLNESLSSQTIYNMPQFFTKSIKVAESSGKLKEILSKMSDFFSSQTKLKNELGTALTYPIFMFFLSAVMIAIMIVYIVPEVTAVFKDMNQELPDATKSLLSITDFLTNNYILLIVIFILLAVSIKLSYRFFDSFRYTVDRAIFALPIVGNLVHNFQIGRFSYIVSTMLKSGVSFTEAIKLSIDVVDNLALKKILTLASIKVVEGNKFSSSLILLKSKLIKKNYLQSLAVGEESSEVAAVLDNISTLYFEENENKTKRLLSLVNPLLMLVVGGVIGLIIFAMLLPMSSIDLGSGF